MARLSRTAFSRSGLLVGSLLLTSCGGGSAVADARQSCRSVRAALAIYASSEQPGISASSQKTLQARALSTLLKGTAAAAAATTMDGGWNPLVTTINEAERVPMKRLVAPLTRLCKVANSATPYL